MMRKRTSWKSEELSIFSLQLYHLLSSGVPLVSSIELLYDQKVIPQNVGKEIVFSLQKGFSFSKALWLQGFPDLFISFIRAAEEHGDYVYGLKQCQSYYQTRARLIQDLIQACTYPLIVLFCVGLSMVFMITVVLPRFAELYQTLGVQLPAITRYMLALTDVVQTLMFFFIVLLVLFLFVILLMQFRFEKIRRLFEEMGCRVPFVKRLYGLRITHYFAIQLGSLLRSGVPLLPSLTLMEKLSPWLILTDAIHSIKTQVIHGESLHDAIRAIDRPFFLSSLAKMVAIGEKTGQLDQSLLSLANSTEIYMRTQLQRLVRSLEPTLIFILGMFIAVTVIAMFLPMLQMVQGM